MKAPLALLVLSLIASAAPRAEAIEPADAGMTVREEKGIYHAAATFSVAQSAPVVFAVLTGYEQIPRYMPDVRGRIGR